LLLLYFTRVLRDCRSSNKEHRRLSFSRSVDTDTSVLPTIVDELRSDDYDVEALPYFQRIAVSGEEMSGVSAAVFAESVAQKQNYFKTILIELIE